MKTLTRLATIGAGGIVMALFIASPAMADTSQSTASALQISLVGGGLASSGQRTASNDGTTETNTGLANPPLAVLGAQNVITAGVLGQVARAFDDGSSGACAGVLGTGGTLTVGPAGDCLVSPSANVVLNLGTFSVVTLTLQADAIYASCTATSEPSIDGSATLVNARIVGSVMGFQRTLLSLPANPAPSTVLSLPGVVNLTLNEQVVTAGGIEVTALSLAPLIGNLAGVEIGDTTCGPNAEAPPVPSIPLQGWPVALGVAGVLAAGVLPYRRFRATTI